MAIRGKSKQVIKVKKPGTPRTAEATSAEQAAHIQSPAEVGKSLVKPGILIVDTDESSRSRMSGALDKSDYDVIAAQSAEDALAIIGNRHVDLVIIGLRCPQMGGLAFCEQVRKNEKTRLISVFINASVNDADQAVEVSLAGADEFLISPLKTDNLRARVVAQLQYKRLMESPGGSEHALFRIARSAESRDPDNGEHCQRLALMAGAMGLALNLPASDIRALECGGYLHDIGKISIPHNILFKAGPLTPSEWEIMKSHAERGERICAQAGDLNAVLPIIRHHHERFDGAGYPDGLAGQQIPLLARIVQIADIYDSLIIKRPYKKPYSPAEALAIIREETKKGWRDPRLTEIFAGLLPFFRRYSITETARLPLQSLSDAIGRPRAQSSGANAGVAPRKQSLTAK